MDDCPSLSLSLPAAPSVTVGTPAVPLFSCSPLPVPAVTFYALSCTPGACSGGGGGAAAGVSILNGLTGSLSLVGLGSVTITTNGVDTIYVSGSASGAGGGVTQAQLDSLSGWAASAANLFATGSYLYRTTTGMSGWATGAFYPYAANPAGYLTTLSGISTGSIAQVSGVLASGIAATGQAAWQSSNGAAGNLSGQLTTTGQTLGALIATSGQAAWTSANGAANTLSGQLTQTGSTLWFLSTGLSGNLLAASGSLLAQIVANSGSKVTVTGSQTLPLVDFTGAGTVSVFLSGARAIFSGSNADALNLSGALAQSGATLLSVIAQTGQQAWTAADNNGRNLSGVIAQTGTILYNDIIGLSGQAAATYATILNLAQTGSTLYTYLTGASGALMAQTLLASGVLGTGLNSLSGFVLNMSGALQASINATGLSGMLVTSGLSGYLVGLISAAAAGVSSLNGQSGILTLQGAGNVSITSGAPGLIIVSGNTGGLAQLIANGSGYGDATFATKLQLASLSGFVGGVSGALDAKIASLSGRADATFATIVTTNLISGNLIQTGVQLGATIAATGQAAYAMTTGLSGWATGTFYPLVANPAGYLTSLSGVSTGFIAQVSGVLQSGIAATGQAAWNSANGAAGNLSGNLTQTGVALLAAIVATGNSAVTHANGIGSILSGALTATGVALGTTIIATGNSAVTHANGIGTIISGNLTATGQTLLTVIANTGQAAWVSANGAANTLSGNATQTGVQILAIIAGLSGVGDGTFVHRTGDEFITGTKTFYSELRFQSGLKTPVQFFGQANYSLLSGAYMVIGTGNLSNVTGILPPPTNYSGVLFTLINGGTTSLQVSGVVGPDTNPILAPWDSYELYATSGQWWPIRQTGSPLLGLINALSGYVIGASGALNTLIALTGQAAWNSANGAAATLSGLLTLTGQSLLTTIVATGTAAVTHANGMGSILSGNMTQTGVALGATIVATGNAAVAHANGIGTNLSGNLTQTGVQLGATIIATGNSAVTHANGIGTILSGNLTQSGIALLAAIVATGTAAVTHANGIGTNLSGNLALTGQQAWSTALLVSGLLTTGLIGLSGADNGIYVHRTGNESISGNKLFLGGIIMQSGLCTGNFAIGTGNAICVFDVLIRPLVHFNVGPGQNGLPPGNSQETFINIDYNTGWGLVDWQPFTDGVANRGIVLLRAGGNLGVGDTNPQSKLSVSGDIRVTNGVFISGGVDITNKYYPKDGNPSGYLTTLSGITTGSSTGYVANVSGVLQSGLMTYSGYADQLFVHRTGAELITGTKTLVSNTVISGNVSWGSTVNSLSGIDVSGYVKARNYVMDLSGISSPAGTGALSGLLNLNFDGPSCPTVTITGATLISGINYGPGKALSVRMFVSGSGRALAWAPQWVFVGSTAPTGLASGKSAILSLQCYDTTDTGVWAAYAAQP